LIPLTPVQLTFVLELSTVSSNSVITISFILLLLIIIIVILKMSVKLGVPTKAGQKLEH